MSIGILSNVWFSQFTLMSPRSHKTWTLKRRQWFALHFLPVCVTTKLHSSQSSSDHLYVELCRWLLWQCCKGKHSWIYLSPLDMVKWTNIITIHPLYNILLICVSYRCTITYCITPYICLHYGGTKRKHWEIKKTTRIRTGIETISFLLSGMGVNNMVI